MKGFFFVLGRDVVVFKFDDAFVYQSVVSNLSRLPINQNECPDNWILVPALLDILLSVILKQLNDFPTDGV